MTVPTDDDDGMRDVESPYVYTVAFGSLFIHHIPLLSIAIIRTDLHAQPVR